MNSVVIVEDDPDTSEMLGEMMSLIGFRVHTSQTGRQAVDLIAEKTPTIVLLDQTLMDYSGLDVLGSIGMDPRLREIPVILISARNLSAEFKRQMNPVSTIYLPKPVGFQELKAAVEQLLAPVNPTQDEKEPE